MSPTSYRAAPPRVSSLSAAPSGVKSTGTKSKSAKTELRLNKARQHAHIPLLVAGLVHRGFGNEGGVGKALVVEQPPEGLNAYRSLADRFVPVELGAAFGFGVVAVPNAHRIEAHRGAGLPHRLRVAFGGDQIVAGHVGVASIQAHAHRRGRSQPLHQLG